MGYTLDMPASGDWMFTNRFLELAGEKLKQRTDSEIQRARDVGLRYLAQDHLIQTVEAEIQNFFDSGIWYIVFHAAGAVPGHLVPFFR